jgi:hypothetical protein
LHYKLTKALVFFGVWEKLSICMVRYPIHALTLVTLLVLCRKPCALTGYHPLASQAYVDLPTRFAPVDEGYHLSPPF